MDMNGESMVWWRKEENKKRVEQILVLCQETWNVQYSRKCHMGSERRF